MAWTTATMIGGGALLGALGGSMKDKSQSESTTNLGDPTALENLGTGYSGDSLSALKALIGAGPGQSDVSNSVGASRDLASMLQQYSQGGYMPSQSDIAQSQSLAQQLYAPQQLAMQQAFQDQLTQANRQAALSGRGTNDPILKAKLAQEQTRQQAMLAANQGAYATQYAQSLPGQRLGYASQRADLLSALAGQAMNNQSSLFNLSQQLAGNERNLRIAGASRLVQNESGGGWKGAITGLMAGAGTGASLAGMGGAGGAGGAAGAGRSMAPMTTGFAASQAYFDQPNPYGPAGGGLNFQQPPPSNPFAGRYQMGSQYGQPAAPWSLMR